jgi:hypothetical protein
LTVSKLHLARDILHELCCPKCLSVHLHHISVTEHGRNLSVSSSGGMNVDVPISSNPGEHPDWLTVLLQCETCGERATLCIAQRTGRTQLVWR